MKRHVEERERAAEAEVEAERARSKSLQTARQATEAQHALAQLFNATGNAFDKEAVELLRLRKRSPAHT